MKTIFKNLIVKTTLFRTSWIFVLFLSINILLDSCKPKFYEAPVPEAATGGSVDFTKYVAVGATMSSGFADNALYTEGQENSYPNLIAAKIKEVNSSLSFVQPDINSANGFSGTSGKGRLLLTLPACTTVAVSGLAQAGETGVLPYTGIQASITNLAVPFIRIGNINTAAVSAGTNFNNPQPYYNRIVNPTTTLGIASEAKQRNGSFFTVELGTVDALRYATSGGTTALVSTAVFQQNINDLLDSLLSVPGSKGVIANVPYVDLFPVVTNNNRRLTSSTDPAKNPVRFRDQVYADSLNTLIGVAGLFSGSTGNKNYYAIQTTAGIRQLNTSKDFIVRSNLLDSVGIGKIDPNSIRTCAPNTNSRTGRGFNSAILNADVLDASEIVTLRAQIDAYNAAIQTLVSAKNASGVRVAIVDLNAFYTKLTDPLYGIQYGASIIRTNHPSLGPDFGGFFSLDRTQPTPKGQALLANEFLKSINSAFGSSFSLYNPDNFRANIIP